jgi:hypothetical protein
MIRRYTTGDFRIYGYLHGVSEAYQNLFDRVLRGPEDPTHAEKLDLLARAALDDSTSDGDWLVFIDGDAFPIDMLNEKISGYLKAAPLVAVQRLENSGDTQPHPCFAVTTVDCWRAYPFSWKEGYAWTDSTGQSMTDVGAGILEVIDRHSLSWVKLHRTNRHNFHPLLFGIYDDLIYHHGAGFRDDKLVRKDINDLMKPQMKRLHGRALLRLIPGVLRLRVRKSVLHPEGRMYRRVLKKNAILSRNVYKEISNDVDRFMNVLKGQSQDNQQ